jgi:hypothetical protein
MPEGKGRKGAFLILEKYLRCFKKSLKNRYMVSKKIYHDVSEKYCRQGGRGREGDTQNL